MMEMEREVVEKMWNRMLQSKSKAKTASTGSREPIYSFCNFDAHVSHKSQRRREPALNPFSDPMSVSPFWPATYCTVLLVLFVSRKPPSQKSICATLICYREIVSSSTCLLFDSKKSASSSYSVVSLKSPQVLCLLVLSLNPHYFKNLTHV